MLSLKYTQSSLLLHSRFANKIDLFVLSTGWNEKVFLKIKERNSSKIMHKTGKDKATANRKARLEEKKIKTQFGCVVGKS